MEQYSVYFKKFKIACAILGAALLIFILLLTQIIPQIQSISTLQTETKTQSEILTDNERKLANFQAEASRKSAENSNVAKAFFKPIESGMDTESIMSDEFGEILKLIRDNQIKTRSIKYDYDPADDNFIKNASDRFTACKLDIEMVANYNNFENFLRDLYKHDHFLEIAKIEIAPYRKNKRILLINIQIKLYAQNNSGRTNPTGQEETQNNAPNNMPSPDVNINKGSGSNEQINPLPGDGLAVPMVNGR